MCDVSMTAVPFRVSSETHRHALWVDSKFLCVVKEIHQPRVGVCHWHRCLDLWAQSIVDHQERYASPWDIVLDEVVVLIDAKCDHVTSVSLLVRSVVVHSWAIEA